MLAKRKKILENLPPYHKDSFEFNYVRKFVSISNIYVSLRHKSKISFLYGYHVLSKKLNRIDMKNLSILGVLIANLYKSNGLFYKYQCMKQHSDKLSCNYADIMKNNFTIGYIFVGNIKNIIIDKYKTYDMDISAILPCISTKKIMSTFDVSISANIYLQYSDFLQMVKQCTFYDAAKNILNELKYTQLDDYDGWDEIIKNSDKKTNKNTNKDKIYVDPRQYSCREGYFRGFLTLNHKELKKYALSFVPLLYVGYRDTLEIFMLYDYFVFGKQYIKVYDYYDGYKNDNDGPDSKHIDYIKFLKNRKSITVPFAHGKSFDELLSQLDIEQFYTYPINQYSNKNNDLSRRQIIRAENRFKKFIRSVYLPYPI